jgi:hypothetical protein
LAKREFPGGRLDWFVYPKFLESVRGLFAISTEIEVREIDPGSVVMVHSLQHRELTVRPEDAKTDLYRSIYEHHEIPFRMRWELDPLPSAVQLIEQVSYPRGKYAFVADHPSRGIEIDKRRLPNVRHFKPDKRRNGSILSFARALQNAEEIHVYEGVWFHFSESLSLTARMVLHRYAKAFIPVFNDYAPTRHKWEILT